MILSPEELDELLKQRPAPAVTDEKVNSLIKEATVYPHRTLTIVVLELQNGAFVVGQSAVVNPENYNQRIGVHYAFLDARRKIWQLEGYLMLQNRNGTKGAAAG